MQVNNDEKTKRKGIKKKRGERLRNEGRRKWEGGEFVRKWGYGLKVKAVGRVYKYNERKKETVP